MRPAVPEEVRWVTLAQDHRATIERRGRSHRAVCTCGWKSHHWNELRPAEADAWHHIYGETVIVDLSSSTQPPPAPTPQQTDPDRSQAVELLVRQAQDLAAKPSPYARSAAPELWRSSGQDMVAIRSAVSKVEGLLARHDRQASRAADSEWLQLITAKRLLLQAVAMGEKEEEARRALL